MVIKMIPYIIPTHMVLYMVLICILLYYRVIIMEDSNEYL